MLYKLFVLIIVLSGCFCFQYPETDPACIILNMDASLQLTQIGDNTLEVSSTLTDAVVDSGTCASENGTNALLYLQKNGTFPVEISFFFTKSADSIVFMDTLVKFNPKDIFNSTETDTLVTADDGQIRLSNDTSSYNCSGPIDLTFPVTNSTDYRYEFKMTITNIAIQAFNIKDGKLSEAEVCSEQPTTDIPSSTAQSQPPETSTSSTPITTPSSTPAPGEPPVQTYTVTGENGTCILLVCGIQFTIKYNTSNEKATKIIGIPSISQVKSGGNCNQPNDTQDIEIMFYEDWKVKMTFSKFEEQSTEKFYISRIDLTANLSRDLFPDIANPGVRSISNQLNTKTAPASLTGSYKCTEEAQFVINNDFVMDTFNLQYAAFQENITQFSESGLSECKNDVATNPDIPIAVGASLGGLIVIVLIAYIIGRRCQERSSYDTI